MRRRSHLAVAGYDPAWPGEFARLQAYLWQHVGRHLQMIDHIGSTAVPSLAAKPVLDVMLVMWPDTDFEQVKQALAALGYEYEGDRGVEGREAFKYERTNFMEHYLYACRPDSRAYREQVALREHLRSNAVARYEYSVLKKRLAQAYPMDRSTYTNSKTSFIKHILKLEGIVTMEKREQLYEGKAKKVYATEDPDLVIVSYKDDATAFNGGKKGTIAGKGVINNRMSNFMMKKLEERGVPTHYVEELNDRETAVKKVTILPLEVIVRNIAAGSFAKRYGVEEGLVFGEPTIEFSYKNDDLGDPLLAEHHIYALGLATPEEVALVTQYTFKVNDFLKAYTREQGIELVDFKIEFGKTAGGIIVLADEISPDTCRFWDVETHEKLDKDRFRRDMGGVEDAYNEVMRRLMGE